LKIETIDRARLAVEAFLDALETNVGGSARALAHGGAVRGLNLSRAGCG